MEAVCTNISICFCIFLLKIHNSWLMLFFIIFKNKKVSLQSCWLLYRYQFVITNFKLNVWTGLGNCGISLWGRWNSIYFFIQMHILEGFFLISYKILCLIESHKKLGTFLLNKQFSKIDKIDIVINKIIYFFIQYEIKKTILRKISSRL